MFSKDQIDQLVQSHPTLQTIIDLKPCSWINPDMKPKSEWPEFPYSYADMLEAEKLWQRFQPFFKIAFAETKATGGILESPLTEISKMKDWLNEDSPKIEGRLFLKCDNALPIVGSIKARGVFFEVLSYAEKLAIEHGLLTKDEDYSCFASEKFRKFFSQYKIGVGSTGNLGLSIGTLSARLGFEATVYMSHDAKQWKKDLLKERGAKVVEFSGDFGEAISVGRKQTQSDPMGYFVDDENSGLLFLGYTTGALELAKQLKEQNLKVDTEHPLCVYSPCGVGGSPSGTAFGLKQIFGDSVHCFFVEPTHSPAVTIGVMSGLLSDISVQDIGIDNKTEADGLAVGRPSQFATRISRDLVSGFCTIEDSKLFKLLCKLVDTEDIFLEPSATAGLIGPQQIAQTSYFEKHKLNMKNATHIAWSTGGDLVPPELRVKFYKKGEALVKG